MTDVRNDLKWPDYAMIAFAWIIMPTLCFVAHMWSKRR